MSVILKSAEREKAELNEIVARTDKDKAQTRAIKFENRARKSESEVDKIINDLTRAYCLVVAARGPRSVKECLLDATIRRDVYHYRAGKCLEYGDIKGARLAEDAIEKIDRAIEYLTRGVGKTTEDIQVILPDPVEHDKALMRAYGLN